MYSSK